MLNINSIPNKEYYHLKVALNDEFKKTAKIKGLVSYIYYPTQRDFPCFGHSELEVEGDSWTLTADECFKAKRLAGMIQSSRTKGFPFFRYIITVTPNQLKQLRENISKTQSIICSRGALQSLAVNTGYSVPFPFTITPFISASYLTAVWTLGSRRIRKIEFYGSQDLAGDFKKCIPGIAGEFFELAAVSSFFYNLVSNSILKFMA